MTSHHYGRKTTSVNAPTASNIIMIIEKIMNKNNQHLVSASMLIALHLHFYAIFFTRAEHAMKEVRARNLATARR